MSAHIINGRAMADQLLEELRREIAALGFSPGLGVVLVGADAASHLYVSLKEKAAAKIGLKFEKVTIEETATEEEIIAAVAALNRRDDIHGIIVQLPLPTGCDADRVIAAIDPRKDADGFHPTNLEQFKNGTSRVAPVLVSGILRLIASTGRSLAGRSALIVANSPAFGEPLRLALEKLDVDADFVRPDEPHLANRSAQADLLVACVGRPEFFTDAMIKPGAIVIDVGTNRLPDGRLVGDVNHAAAQAIAGFVTPVPGGVGPMTVATLLSNVVTLAKK